MVGQRHDRAATAADVPLSKLLKMLLCYGQRMLVYPAGFPLSLPDNIYYPSDFGIPYMAPLIRTSDGIALTCFLLPQTDHSLSRPSPSNREIKRGLPRIQDVKIELTPAAADARATVVVFHGNGEHHWEDMSMAGHLFWHKCNVLLVSYRGYSLSTGHPSEEGLRRDAQAALDWLLAQPYVSQVPIILHGHSLGGAVAIDVASRNPDKITALMLSCTFTSIPDIVRTWPVLRHFSFLCTQRWNSAAKIRKIPRSVPILMSSGRKDEVVPPELMDRLWETAKGRGEERRRVREGVKEKVEEGVARVRMRMRMRMRMSKKGKEKEQQHGFDVDIGSESGVGEKASVRSTSEHEPDGEESPSGDVWQEYERGTHCGTPATSSYRSKMKSFIDSVVGPDTTNISFTTADSMNSLASRRSLTLPPDAGDKRIPDVRWHWKDGKLYKRELGQEDEGVPPREWFEYPRQCQIIRKVNAGRGL